MDSRADALVLTQRLENSSRPVVYRRSRPRCSMSRRGPSRRWAQAAKGRIICRKSFCRDRKSARQLNTCLAQAFAQPDIFRIDHGDLDAGDVTPIADHACSACRAGNTVEPQSRSLIRQDNGDAVVPRTTRCGGTTTSCLPVRPFSIRSVKARTASAASSWVFWLTVVRLMWASLATGLSS